MKTEKVKKSAAEKIRELNNAEIETKIAELKQDMKKYNNVLERLIHAEDSIKSAHYRIDRLKEIKRGI